MGAENDFQEAVDLALTLTGSHAAAKTLIAQAWGAVHDELAVPGTWKLVNCYASALLQSGTISWRDRHRIVRLSA